MGGLLWGYLHRLRSCSTSSSSCNSGGLISVSWGLDDGWGFVRYDPANFTWFSTPHTFRCCLFFFFLFAAGCFAQDVLTSYNSSISVSPISVSPSARGFCVNETYSFFVGDGTFAPVALPLVAHREAVSPSARGFCVNETYSFFLGDGTFAPVALPLVAHHTAAHNIDQGLALLVAVS